MKIHHVGIAVQSLAASVPLFEKLLGVTSSEEETVTGQKVRATAFSLAESRLELLEATAPDSPIARFIAKRGPGIHHVALSVPNLSDALAELEKQGFRLVDRAPSPGAGSERIAFLHPASTAGVLIELIEEA